ncbi:myb proto-oncogene protein [Vigna unguiculata]|uniref:MYB transcription factor n=1 Tax=Vigna unguiculata TaxID=3917 RepID=A0A4D6KUK1_VIGUN|nr:myb proto-oncogene protein [Vigna unguiculata]
MTLQKSTQEIWHLARDAIETGDFRSPISHLSNLHQIVSSLFQLRAKLDAYAVYICLPAKSASDKLVMGAPKQKWTAEEEAALKAGVIKHGVGKWRTILKDPEFNNVLYLRSNVDLKDKWRNLSVMANGWSSREKSRLAVRRVHHTPKQDEHSMSITPVAPSDEDIVDVKPLQISRDTVQILGPKRSNLSLDKLIMEAITSLKENGGSNKTAIAAFIEDQYWALPDLKRMLSAKLKFLTASGKLIKVNRKYRIAPTAAYSDRRRNSSMLFLDGRQKASMKMDKDETNILTKSQIDLELAKIRSMTPQEAAAFAARAVAEAEAAIAEAEEAAKEAEAAEADAEAAQAFADATTKSGKGRKSPRRIVMRERSKSIFHIDETCDLVKDKEVFLSFWRHSIWAAY